MAREFAAAAEDMGEYGRSQREQWRLRIGNGRLLSDRNLGVVCVAHPTDSASVLIRWHPTDTRQRGGDEHVETVELWRAHLEALRTLHRQPASRARWLALCSQEGLGALEGSRLIAELESQPAPEIGLQALAACVLLVVGEEAA